MSFDDVLMTLVMLLSGLRYGVGSLDRVRGVGFGFSAAAVFFSSFFCFLSSFSLSLSSLSVPVFL